VASASWTCFCFSCCHPRRGSAVAFALLPRHNGSGAPSFAHFAIGVPNELARWGEGGEMTNAQPSTTHLPLPVPLTQNQDRHFDRSCSLVSSGAEKSASLPSPFPSHFRLPLVLPLLFAFGFAFAFCLCFLPLLFAFAFCLCFLPLLFASCFFCFFCFFCFLVVILSPQAEDLFLLLHSSFVCQSAAQRRNLLLLSASAFRFCFPLLLSASASASASAFRFCFLLLPFLLSSPEGDLLSSPFRLWIRAGLQPRV
jgi:hypothetical protein